MAEPYTIKMPQLSDTMTEGVVVSWEKNVGDKIQRGDIVATVETDKAVMDVEVFREGYLSGPLAAVDSTVPVGDPIAYLVANEDEVRGEGDAAPGGASAATQQTAAAASQDQASAGSDVAAGSQSSPGASTGQGSGGARQPDGVTHVIKMPQLSDTMTEGVVVSWEKNPSDKIERGDVVATVETDKAVMDVEVFREGYLSGPFAPVDATVPVGDPLAYLVESSEQVVKGEADVPAGAARAAETESAPAAESSGAQTGGGAPAKERPTPGYRPPQPQRDIDAAPAPRPDNKYATPRARQLAAELHVNLNNLKGTGPDGAITADDVQKAQPIERPSEVTPAPAAHDMPEVQVPGHGRKMSASERAVSRAMTAALTLPTFRVMIEADTNALIKSAKKLGVSVTVAIAKACAVAIQQHPRINWAYQPQDKLVERDQIDIGMAVAAEDGGLVVPVLRHCESRPLEELNDDWKDLVSRARKRRVKPEEYSNPTFQVSNMGMLGVSYFDAIPTPGIAAILAISAARAEGTPFTVTADHRVVNGAMVAEFLQTLKHTVEHPEDWMGAPGPHIPEGDWDYDVLVIGGGPGGEDCARDLAGHGLKVAMINDSPLPGGECLWRGCIPSKTWRAAADRIRDRGHDDHLGVEGTSKAKLNWGKLETTRREVLENRGELALKTDKGVKVAVKQGFAWFETDHRVFVDTSGNTENPHQRAPAGDGSKGEHITFGCAVIATGAPPFVPPIEGARERLESGGVLTSDTVWKLKETPRRLAIIGAGAIGAEMAQIFQDFGTKVLLLEARERILSEVEDEVAKNAAQVMGNDPNLDVHTSVSVDSIEGEPGAMKLLWSDADGKQHQFSCDRVLMATGKRPELAPLKLNDAGIEAENGAIKVDARCRTSVPHIYAVGDAIGGLMLAHTAGQQGRVAAAAILGEELKYDQALDCGVIFTRPQAAFVGLSVAQAKEKGIDAVEVKTPLSIDAKAQITGETEGLIKIVADKASHRIVGVHLLADHADTLIGEAVMVVSAGLTLEQVGQAIHPHPTQTELFGDLARRLLSRLRRSEKKKAKAKS